ncbi:MAG TPA: DUF4352 domain-containing protein [Candidatus Limnocylindria bacterium]|nr:DUF4352 domain-containing protein [Candidatus Limnocylindria bacterium]
MESGIYVTFFDSGEASNRALPPVGPLDRVVVRHHDLVAERIPLTQPPDMGADIARWLEAELELQRATGEEPGGPKRSEMRFAARGGVYLRFAVFGDLRERDPIPEFGPFAVVVVGRRGVEGDGQLLATRTSSELAAWELTGHAGEVVGTRKPDIALRTNATAYHPQIAPAAPRAGRIVEPAPPPARKLAPIVLPPTSPAEPEPLFRQATPPEREQSTPPAEEPPALTPGDLALIQRVEQQRAEETLRARIQDEERRRLGVDESDDEASTWAMRYRAQPANEQTAVEAGGGFELGVLLWRLRFAIIGLLLLGVGAYGFTMVRTGGISSVPGQQAIKIVGIAQKVSSPRWDYIVNGVQRTDSAGTAKARGVFYVVRIGVTNRGTEGAQLSPSEFVLTDANGTEHRAEALASGAYYGPGNPQSQFVWPQSFPIGKSASLGVVFDVDPSLGRGMQLQIADLPDTRVKLD